MRIVKPYGRSKTVWNEGKTALIRKLDVEVERGEKVEKAIPEFAKKHPELVIEQWISVIDTIFTKPKGDENPTEKQREFRKKIGDACWELIQKRNLLEEAQGDDKRIKKLKQIWDFKISPYGAGVWKAKDKKKKPPYVEGRWHKHFLKDAATEKISYERLAEDIHNHLHVAEERIRGGWISEENRTLHSYDKGRIIRRAESIDGGVYIKKKEKETRPITARRKPIGGWQKSNGENAGNDENAYKQKSDVAALIVAAVQEYEKFHLLEGTDRKAFRDEYKKAHGDEQPLKPHYAAAALLRQKYRKLFPNAKNTGALPMKEVREGDDPSKARLLILHNAVRDFYTRTLKHAAPLPKKDKKAEEDKKAGKKPFLLSQKLPQNADALFKQIGFKQDNRELNRLVRLGKIIHYESSGASDDHTANSVNAWPDKRTVETSEYWTSDGQARIKRNEALVRIWRHVLALAQRTLTDWAIKETSSELAKGDIIGGEGAIKEALGQFNNEHHLERLKILFGQGAEALSDVSDDKFNKNVLEFALRATATLRNNAFHFKGLAGFISALKQLEETKIIDDDSSASHLKAVLSALKQLWQQDKLGERKRLLDTMEGADFGYFFKPSQNKTLVHLLESGDDTVLALPRFGRMMQRATDSWKGKNKLSLPLRPNRMDLEASPARRCQYQALKMLYEGPFRQDLLTLSLDEIRRHTGRAIERTKDEAKKINPQALKNGQLIEAKAAYLAQFGQFDDRPAIEQLFFKLSEATATEMRVQRGYESDGEKAREQAEYIENFKCDVLALAFDDWLRLHERDIGFVLKLKPKEPKPEKQHCAVASLELPAKAIPNADDWQIALYFLMHLVPVEEVSKLLHQLRKWQVLASPEKAGPAKMDVEKKELEKQVRQLQTTLSLYLAMHDAKYEGGEALSVPKEYAELFEQGADFHSVFRKTLEHNSDKRLPLRGMREMLRFGGFRALHPIFKEYAISHDDVKTWQQAEAPAQGQQSDIAVWQQKREDLHKRWVKEGSEFPADAKERYRQVLAKVTHHRHLSAHITLTNHVRLHRLLMQVLGRLVDYSGLWERDLYFVTLALLYENSVTPQQVFTPESTKANGEKQGGCYYLGNGQILAALRTNSIQENVAYNPLNYLKKCFSKDATFEELGKIRNAFAHFNMLQQRASNANKAVYEKMTYEQASERVPNLTGCVNCARDMMAYDRKLKNAVSQSVMELLEREGVHLSWQMRTEQDKHLLKNAELKPKQAQHLSKNSSDIYEDLHGEDYINMVAGLFGANAKAVYEKENEKPLVNQSRPQNASLTLV